MRIWHASRDAYHCSFRLVRILLSSVQFTMELERLRVLDMFVLFPELLHKISMPSPIRAKFREIGVARPDDKFVRLPGTASVFQGLRLFQNSAVTQLTAKALVSSEKIREGMIALQTENVPPRILERAKASNSADANLMTFLRESFANAALRGPDNLYKRVGLPSRSMIL